jgi:hypothetical protein
MTTLLLAEFFSSSCAGSTRASIIFAKKMDGRVKPGHDEFERVPA